MIIVSISNDRAVRFYSNCMSIAVANGNNIFPVRRIGRTISSNDSTIRQQSYDPKVSCTNGSNILPVGGGILPGTI